KARAGRRVLDPRRARREALFRLRQRRQRPPLVAGRAEGARVDEAEERLALLELAEGVEEDHRLAPRFERGGGAAGREADVRERRAEIVERDRADERDAEALGGVEERAEDLLGLRRIAEEGRGEADVCMLQACGPDVARALEARGGGGVARAVLGEIPGVELE